VRDRPDVDVASGRIVVRPSCHGSCRVVGASSAGSLDRLEVVVGEVLFLRSTGWVGVPAGLHDGALVALGVFLVCWHLAWPCGEIL